MSLVEVLTAFSLCLSGGREEIVAIEGDATGAVVIAHSSELLEEGELIVDEGCESEWCSDACDLDSCKPRFSLGGMIARLRASLPSLRCSFPHRFHAYEVCAATPDRECHPVFRLPRLGCSKPHRIPCESIDMSDREVDGIPTNDWPEESTPTAESEPCTNCGGYVKPMPAKVHLLTETPATSSSTRPLPTDGPDNGVRVSPVQEEPTEEDLSPVPTEESSAITAPITPVGLQEVDPREEESSVGPSWGHGEGHAWLVGKIEYLHLGGGAWVLRYLPYDQTDEFGGSVVLVQDSRFNRFNDGDVVKVLGEVVRKESGVYRGRALYRVRGVQLVEPMRIERE